MTKKKFQGTGTALVTPFKNDGSIDEVALRRLVEFQIRGGIDMIVPCGTTGEGATLESEEADRVLRIVIEEARGRALVVLGAGSNSTSKAVQGAERAKRNGADGVLSVGPYYNKPTQTGYYEHFKAVAEVGCPVIVYNVPSRTGGNIEAATMLRLAELPHVVATKEASGNLAQIMEIIRNRPPEFRVLSGDDGLALPLIALGGDGLISVVSNETPGMMSELIDAALEGNFTKAREIHYKLLPLIAANFVESNPIPVKAVLSMMGLIEENYRLPMVPLSQVNRAPLQKLAGELKLLVPAGAQIGTPTGAQR
jgi:4-hydroxy-tetrahydrodipicolinate synthase